MLPNPSKRLALSGDLRLASSSKRFAKRFDE
jgi:hypothetical protein